MLTFHDLKQFEQLLKVQIYKEYHGAILRREKVSVRALSRKYKCCNSTIHQIINDDSFNTL